MFGDSTVENTSTFNICFGFELKNSICNYRTINSTEKIRLEEGNELKLIIWLLAKQD